MTFERIGEESIINKVSKIRYNNKQCSKSVTFLPSSSFKAECRVLSLMLKENMVAIASLPSHSHWII